jgi:hypothetical protein
MQEARDSKRTSDNDKKKEKQIKKDQKGGKGQVSKSGRRSEAKYEDGEEDEYNEEGLSSLAEGFGAF